MKKLQVIAKETLVLVIIGKAPKERTLEQACQLMMLEQDAQLNFNFQ